MYKWRRRGEACFYIADSDTPNRILDLPYYSFRMDQFYKLGLYDPGI